MKKWEKPKLIVLVRSNPAELVLGDCKGGLYGQDGPYAVAWPCYEDIQFESCGQCYHQLFS